MKIGERIRKERKNMGMKLKDLAREVDFNNYQTLSSIEKGEREIRVGELDKIAKALGLTVSYLLGETEGEEEKVLWRKCSDECKCKKFENELKSFCDNYRKLCDLVGYKYKKFIPPGPEKLQKERYENDYEFAKGLAKKYRTTLKLGRYPGNNLIDALQEENILIFCRDLGDFGSAASLVGDFGVSILLNKKDRPWRRTFDIAHELFHLITWYIYPPAEVYDDEERGKSEPEKYADAFASSLLLPEESLRDEVEKNQEKGDLGLVDIIELASKFKVSIQALTWRLQNLTMFSSIWNELKRKVFSNLDWEEIRNHPKINKLNEMLRGREKEMPELPEIFVAQAMKTYQQGRVTKLKLAEYLGKDYGELSYFLKSYSYPDIEEFDFGSIYS